MNIFRFKNRYSVLNRIEISKANLISNYKNLSSINPKIKIAPVLKSNGYGHGILEVARILDPLKAPFFCVDSLYEAYELLKAGVKTSILIMGYTDPQNFKVKKLPFSYALFDLETAEILNKYQPGCKVHIFVDTGMNREGIAFEDLPKFLNQLKKLKNIQVEGLMSHLAMADNPNHVLTKKQLNNLMHVQQIVRQSSFNPKWIHLANSEGLLNLGKDLGLTNLARVGLALYGISSDLKLKPVLTFKTKIIQIKKLNKGKRVGYSGTFIARRNMLMGVLPLGYYDGVDRMLSNKGYATIDGIPCPIIGRVSMNITTIDLTNVQNPKIGQEVFVYSNNRTNPNSIVNTSKICQTIPYDLLVHLAESTKRVVV